MRIFVFIAALAVFAASSVTFAAVPRDFAVDLKATVSDSVPHITLSWTQRVQSNITAQKVHRRLKGATTWTKLADLTTTQTSYTDSTALPNVEYEYWMERNLTGLTPSVAMGYLSAGVKVPEVHARGTLLLVIDDTMITPLAPEIAQLKLDLVADGWVVQQITAPRSGTATSTKALLTAAYNADATNVKAIYLLGHVPVPYSGNQAPDGHGDHVGAWPADGYYGEMNGTWTDTTVNNTTASRNQNDNIPGDGKFDQVSFPSLVELQVGRVDLHTLNRSPATGVTETARLRRYLRRAHDFRMKQGAYVAIPRRTLIRDGFGHAFTSEPFAVTAWMGAFACVGQAPDAPIDEAPADQWFTATYASGKDYLWGHGCGGGSYEYADTLGVSMEFGRLKSRVVFTSMFGSYHGDWDADNALMRSVIAGNATGDSLGLTCFWAGRPNWFPHQPGMGETMGYMTRTSMNGGVSGGGSYVPGGSSYQGVHIGLMGDPALRMHAVEPPRQLAGRSSGGQISLSWAASTESALQGYHVYRSATAAGPFTRLTASPQAGTTYLDTTVTAGSSYTYLVRTLKLESVPGGSYYNLSVGSPITLTASNAASPPPFNPSELSAATPTSATSSVLTWRDNSSDETAFRIERKTNAAGTWGTLTTLAAGTTTHTDVGPFTQGNVYYYRVVAVGAAGDSIASNESSFDAVAGFLEISTTMMKVNKNAGTATITVNRFGGAVGAVAVSYATANSSALAGSHYTTMSGTLNWPDGDTTARTIAVPITNNASAQQARQFKVTLSSATNGAAIAQWSTCAVQIEDPTATLDPAWTSTVLGTLTDSSPAVSAENVIGDSTMGGSGVTSGATSEAGRFIYQNRTGDGIMTMQVPTPTPAQGTARFALMVRASTANNAITAASVGASAAANFGTKLAYRTTVGGGMTVTPSADNNLDTPQWLRLTRAGSTFTAESSPDGTTWTVLGSATVSSMPVTALWGIFHYSADWAASSTYLGDYQLATYEDVSLAALPTPDVPGSFGFGTVTNASVQLTWFAPEYAAGYRIERRGDDGSYDLLADISSGATQSYSDASIRADTGYEYRILAYNGTGQSAWSSIARTLTPGPDVVFNITTEDGGGADATIRFDTPAGNFGSLASMPITGTALADGAMTPVAKAWLRFDLGSMPSIKSAKLKLAYIGEENLDATFNAGSVFWLVGRLLAETSDAWNESAVTWNDAPQNNTASLGVTGTSQQIVSAFYSDSIELPAVNSVSSFTLSATTLNTNRGANNLLTIALFANTAQSGTMLWAAREHATLPPPTLEVTTASTQPKRPGFLAITPGSGSSMVLTWVDFTSDETAFQIERRAANGEWTLIQTNAANATTFTDTSALPGVIYDYRVRAVTPSGTSSWATAPVITHAGAASISGAITSADGIAFNRADVPPQRGYVPTGLTYYSPASTFASSVTLSTSALRNNFNGWMGMKITTGASPVVVRELGRWVVSGNSAAHTVKFVNATTNTDVPGASVVVNTAGASVGFAYTPLAMPVTLAANTAYYLVSSEVSGGDQWYEGNNTLTYATSVATVNQSAFSSNGTSFSLSFSANNTYIPLNFRYSSEATPLLTSHSMTKLRNDVTGWLGLEFTTGSTVITIPQLGRWVVAGNTGTHAVRLVLASDGSTLGTVNIDTAGAPAGQFKYASLPTAITLAANTSYYLLSQETASGDMWYDFTQAAQGSPTAYQEWLLANGLPMDGSATGSATATPVSDGVPNLIKYALGLNPASSGHSGRLAHGTVTDSGQDYLTFTYTRPEPAPAGVSYTVEGCANLNPASWSSAGIDPISSTVNAGLRTITMRDSESISSGSKRFLRLKVSQP
ncbi:MAG: hypothetical protein JNJ83_02930 [Verrucomicrobiaceae bacterium]|nr:hypothetical protein [Verrucomicrobiaceae bacterium]